MNYIGSKLSLLDFLVNGIERIAWRGCKTFCDIFAGTGAVGSRFKEIGYKIIANDVQYYAYVLNRHYIGNHKPLLWEKLDIFSTLSDGWDKTQTVCDYLDNLQECK